MAARAIARAEQVQPAAEVARIPAISPEELKKWAAEGSIRIPGVAVPVAKDGADVAGLGKVIVQFILVTPELAQRWLLNNFRNRPVKDDVVEAYARDAVAGQFVTTHQGVAFNDRDELIDGQHRLLAIVKSQKPLVLMCSFGWPSKIEGREMTTMDVVDRGLTRSVPDQLKIQHGLKEATHISKVTSSIAPICCNERTRRLSVGQTLEIYRTFQTGIDRVIEHRSQESGLKTAGVMAGFAFAMTADFGATPEYRDGLIETWFKTLVSGESIAALPAMAHLREFLVSDAAILLSRRHDRALAELTLQAIWCQMHQRPVEEVAVSRTGADFFTGLQKDRVEKVAAMFRLPKNEK